VEAPYVERLKHLYAAWDPTLLLVQSATIERARWLVKTAESGPLPSRKAERELPRARAIVADAVHPVTGDILPTFCRRSTTVPVNALIAAAMLSTSSVSGTAALHVYYQSYASLVRYANHSDERHPLNPTRLWMGYGLATSCAVAIGVGAARALRDAPRRLRPLRMAVPHAAVACAGALGIYLHNAPDAQDGVEVVDCTGRVQGVSVRAGEATLSRALALHAVVLPACQLLLPPLAMRYLVLPRLTGVQGLQRLSIAFPLALTTTAASVAGVAPLAAAAFPRRLSFDPADLEPQFRRAAARDGAAEQRDLCSRGTSGLAATRLYSAKGLY